MSENYNEYDIAVIDVLVKEEAMEIVKELNLKGKDKFIALDMLYKQIMQDKYNIKL